MDGIADKYIMNELIIESLNAVVQHNSSPYSKL